MSSRTLRKLGKSSLEDELAKYNKVEEESSSEDEESEVEETKTRSANAFALLNNDEESEESEEEEEEEKEEEEGDDNNNTGESDIAFTKPIAKNVKSKGKSKKHVKIDDLNDDELDKLLENIKLKDRQSATPEVDSTLDNAEYSDISTDSEDEGETLPPWPTYSDGGRLLTPKKLNKCTKLISFDWKFLNPDKEYENFFGKLSSSAINDADQSSSTAISPELLSQIKKLSKRIRGWSGNDHKSIPGTTRKLKLTKIKDDWLPIAKKPLSLDEMSKDQLLNLFTSKFKNDWKDILIDDINNEFKYGIRYYNLSQGPSFSSQAITEFFMSVVVQPDHESLISLLQKFPYNIETILQVSNILQRQGSTSNVLGLIERALFVFDWSLSNTFEIGNGKSRLPYEFFFNRQVYLAVFRYISILTQKSLFFTSLTYCKLLLSFDPRDDPFGVRYFIDYYSFLSDDFQYLIDFVNSNLCQCYEEWLTAPLLYTVSYCYFKLDKTIQAKESLKLAYEKHPFVGHAILENIGHFDHPWLLTDVNDTVKLISSMYTNRLGSMLGDDNELKSFIINELSKIIETIGKPNLSAYYNNNLEEIPVNLVRHVILSGESAVMAKIPESFWSNNEVYEFDVLPPKIGTTIYNYIDDNQVSAGVLQNSMRAEEIRQFEDLLQQNIIERR